MKFKKSLGQNFLIDKNVINKILNKVSPLISDNFLEIGPGEGALTYPLINKIAKLLVIEKDQRLSIKLSESLNENNKITVVNHDVLKIKLEKYVDGKIRVIGNLPYNIATEIIFFLLNSKIKIQDIHVIAATLIIIREIFISGLREFIKGNVLKVTFLAKVKTTVQMISIIILIKIQLLPMIY